MSLGNKISIKNIEQLEMHLQLMRDLYTQNKSIEFDIVEKKRTLTQNDAIHLYCKQVAQALSDAGYTVENFFKEGYEIPWSMYLVKDNIWRVMQKAITSKQSTTEIKRKDCSEIYEAVNNALANKGIHVPFPSKDRL